MKPLSRDRLADIKLRGMIVLIAATALLLALTAAIVEWLVDPGIGSFGDSLWWAISTVTTVGYGDVVPTSSGGRLIGGVLMLIGIAIIPTITSLVVSVFIAQRSRDTERRDEEHREQVLKRLDELDERLGHLLGDSGG